MPDLSALAEKVIEDVQTPDTVTMSIPEEAVKIDVENNTNSIEQTNPQEQTPTLASLSTNSPQTEDDTVDIVKQNIPTSNMCALCGLQYLDNEWLAHKTQYHDKEETITKIECDRCHKILNSKEEVPAHNLEMHNGRPCYFCEHRQEMMDKTNEFIERAKSKDKPFIPYEEDLAIFELDVDEDTITNWKNKTIGDTKELEHPEFFGAIKKLLTLQKLYLLKRTIGRYNPTGSIFQLKVNHGMMETEKKIHMGEKDSEPISIKIIEDAPKIINE